MTKSSSLIDIVIYYNNKLITSASNTKFVGLVTKNSLSWKAHIDQMIPKLRTAHYAINPFTPDTLKLVYCSYFHSLMNYGIIFWGNSAHSVHVFRQQKKGNRIITRSRPKDSCRELFKKLNILLFQLLYFHTICSKQ